MAERELLEILGSINESLGELTRTLMDVRDALQKRPIYEHDDHLKSIASDLRFLSTRLNK